MVEAYHLTGSEYWLVQDPELFYTKHKVVAKVYLLLGELNQYYAKTTEGLPAEALSVSPKIYKGENYQLLPYVMLDHPRYFRGENAFAVRSLFWWGQHFSIHLVLGGKYKEQFGPAIEEAIKDGCFHGWFASLTNDPWHHHFETDNYIPAEHFSRLDPSAGYLKLGKYLTLDKWDGADAFFRQAFDQLMTALNSLRHERNMKGS